MSASIQNIYPGDNQVFADLFDKIENNGKIDEEILMLLCGSNQISISEKFKLLQTVSTKNCKYIDFLLKFIANNPSLVETPEIKAYLNDYFHEQARRSSLLADDEIIRIWRYHAYLISQGIACFYPYIWMLICNHGEITTFSNSDLKIISHYSAVFAFDGFNSKPIKQILLRSPTCSERDLEIFKYMRNKRETAYSQYATALLHLMKTALKQRKFDPYKFNDMLSDIPKKYRGELYVDSCRNNCERLHYNLKRFYKDYEQNQIIF